MTRLIVGDPEHIRLAQLTSKYNDAKPTETKDCGCSCPYCDAQYEACPKCGDEIESFIEQCNCGQKIIPYKDYCELIKLKKKILKNN